MQIRLAYKIDNESIVDGPGIRSVIWTQGCSHNCKGCHNPETHSFSDGFLMDTKDVIKEIKNNISIDGVTFSGGDPMFQVDACLEIARDLKKMNLNIWCYTGFTFENLIKMSETNNAYLEFLNTLDVLVDGKFVLEKRQISLLYKGSTNQRVIDVQRSLKEKRVILSEKYNNKEEILYKKPQGIFI